MKARLSYKPISNFENSLPIISISGSKSESNRLLILQRLNPNIIIENLSNSEDTQLLKKGLETDKQIFDVHHAGTTMRFLTAYFSSKEGKEIILTGSNRMKKRPIGILVDSLRELGADIQYLEEEGYPPIQIRGKKLKGDELKINAEISSQFISAMMLIAAGLSNGLSIDLKGEMVSRSYVDLTLGILNKAGIGSCINENRIEIKPYRKKKNVTILVESDWSSASYYYSIVALSDDLSIKLKNFSNSSLQGDSIIASIYELFGVSTNFDQIDQSMIIKKTRKELPDDLQIDLQDTPDIAQTIAVTCFGLGIKCTLSGLYTLKFKETNRLKALKKELESLGANVEITSDSIKVNSSARPIENTEINTYEDHRMAMAFAPLAIKTSIVINHAEVVSKSYPSYWKDLEKTGYSIVLE